jgi:hypothetical protein
VEVSKQMEFSIGDQVRVSDDWFVAQLRGWVGRIAQFSDRVPDKRKEGVYWVEFDSIVTDKQPRPITGAEIDADFLTKLPDADD